MRQQLIVIQGATASGKTGLGVALAKRLNTVVISADSRQFYKELAIGTAKPTEAEMDGITHYFTGSHSIHEPVTAAQFEKEALQLIRDKLSDKQYIIVAGGSGMFIDALCIGLDAIPADNEVQEQLRKELAENGIEPLLAELQEADTEYYKNADTGNPPRILRALEVWRISGKPYSEWRARKPEPRPFDVHRFTITHSRDELYKRINVRVDRMMEAGLLEEARSVYENRSLAPLQTVGYKECFDYFDGTIDLGTCVEKIKQHTRNYAKRQLTWFRKHPEAVSLPFSAPDTMANGIISYLHSGTL